MSTRSSAVRAIASSTFLAMGVVLAALGVVLMEARHSLLTPDGLAQRAGAILADPRVAAYAADRATTAVLEHQPDLTGFRPIIASVASATVSSPAFQRAAQAGVRTAASALLSEGGSRVTMSIPDLGILLRGAVAQANPALAERIPPRVRVSLSILARDRYPGPPRACFSCPDGSPGTRCSCWPSACRVRRPAWRLRGIADRRCSNSR